MREYRILKIEPSFLIYDADHLLIAGAGVGGVATAARLAKAGYKVTVLEKNDFTGGRCSLIHREGYVSIASGVT